MSIIGNVFYKKVLPQGRQSSPPQYNAIAEYPFENAAEGIAISRFSRIKNLISLVEDRITKKCTENFPGRMGYVLLKKRLDKALGLDMTSSMGVMKPQTSSDVVTRFDGEWLGMPLCTGSMEYSAENIRRVIDFARQMESEGRNFLVFENPNKFCDCIGYENYYDENRKIVNDTLRGEGVRVVDLDDYMETNGIRHRDIFLKTDHHWQPRAGLWGNSILTSELNKQFGFHIDTSIFDLENYESTILPKQFLGSLGKKVTEVYTEKEDFEILIPKYENDITVFSSAYCETRRGKIPELLYDYKFLEPKSAYVRNEYALYCSGDQALITSHNNKLHDGSNLLLIHFSFADVQIPTLTQAVEDFYAIDLRHFTGSLQAFIKEKNPSTVVLAYMTSSFINKWTEPTAIEQRNKFDFR